MTPKYYFFLSLASPASYNEAETKSTLQFGQRLVYIHWVGTPAQQSSYVPPPPATMRQRLNPHCSLVGVAMAHYKKSDYSQSKMCPFFLILHTFLATLKPFFKWFSKKMKFPGGVSDYTLFFLGAVFNGYHNLYEVIGIIFIFKFLIYMSMFYH